MKETTQEQLDKMSLPEKVSQHAKDVMATENSSRFLRMSFEVVGGFQDGEHQVDYPTREGQYTYDFLLGSGSLGHPLRPTIVGKSVLKVAELVDTSVSFLDFTYARFSERINQEAIEKAFFPVWEMSERLKALPQPAAQSAIEECAQQARLALSQIKP